MSDLDSEDALNLAPLSRMKRRHTYRPVGTCIYCGANGAGTLLSLEHVIPESLGGTLKLPQASCRACEIVTGAFEGRNVSRLFQIVRKQFGLPRKSRSSKDRERQHQELFSVKIDGREVGLSSQECPGLLVSFLFDFPTALMGITPTLEPFVGRVQIVQLPGFGERFDRLRARYGQQANIEFPINGNSEEVGRLLAKIGHAYAVAEIGLGVFRPFLLGIIRGGDTYLLRHLVGSAIGESDAATDDLHEIGIVPPALFDCGNLVVAKIRLFANQGLTTHYVVVGERL